MVGDQIEEYRDKRYNEFWDEHIKEEIILGPPLDDVKDAGTVSTAEASCLCPGGGDGNEGGKTSSAAAVMATTGALTLSTSEVPPAAGIIAVVGAAYAGYLWIADGTHTTQEDPTKWNKTPKHVNFDNNEIFPEGGGPNALKYLIGTAVLIDAIKNLYETTHSNPVPVTDNTRVWHFYPSTSINRPHR